MVLVGPSGSGKSAWAAEHYRPHEVVSSDRLRAVVGSGEHDLDASADAFALPFPPAAARLDQLETAIETLRALWQPGTKEHRGSRVWLPETTCYPRPAAPIRVIGRDREDAASIVEKLRGRTTAAAFARSHHAGTADDHIGRYRLLADRGVKTVFVSLPDLTGPEDVLRLAPVAAAFAGGAW